MCASSSTCSLASLSLSLCVCQVATAVSLDKVMEEEFKKLASLCRHGKFGEAEDLINQPDWRLPIDYQVSQSVALRAPPPHTPAHTPHWQPRPTRLP